MFNYFETMSRKEKEIAEKRIKMILFDLYHEEENAYLEWSVNIKSMHYKKKYKNYGKQIECIHILLSVLGVDIDKLKNEYYEKARNGSK